MFKPPFLNEQGAIDDCIHSVQTAIELGVNTISINPVNIQRGTLVEYLWLQNRYRPPWYYSLFKAMREAFDQQDLHHTRIVSDPSGAGSKRGIHNCLRRECNFKMKEILNEFVLNQDTSILEKIERLDPACECHLTYQLQKDFF
ncbi:MAG: hypothetical protein EU548_07940 [Promethearchaeota archaeon]|nr:MAG: hypothetical protein EU548_07940 [Candidatus Lokiarchaeota archaeon]